MTDFFAVLACQKFVVWSNAYACLHRVGCFHLECLLGDMGRQIALVSRGHGYAVYAIADLFYLVKIGA